MHAIQRQFLEKWAQLAGVVVPAAGAGIGTTSAACKNVELWAQTFSPILSLQPQKLLEYCDSNYLTANALALEILMCPPGLRCVSAAHSTPMCLRAHAPSPTAV